MSLLIRNTKPRRTESPTSPRFKVRFKDPEAMQAALAMEASASEVRVINRKRRFLGVRRPAEVGGSGTARRAFEAYLRSYEEIFAGEVVEDFQYSMEGEEIFGPESFRPEASTLARNDPPLLG